MKFHNPWNPLANGGAGGPGADSAEWVNANVLAGIKGSVIPADVPHDLQKEICNVIEAGGLEQDPDDLTQLLQAIQNLTRVSQTPGIETGYFDMFVPSEYATVQLALDYLSSRDIPNDVTVRINVAAGDYNLGPSSSIVAEHPKNDRIQIIGAPITFPSAATINQSTHSAAEAAIRGVWGTRFVVQGATKAGLYVKNHTLGLIKNIAFIGDNTAGQHGVLIGDWENGLGRAGARIEDCWAHRCGEDGFRANYNSEVLSLRVGGSYCGKQGTRVANGSVWTAKDEHIGVRNVQAGLLVVNASFYEGTGVNGGMTMDNNGLNGVVAYGGGAELVLQQGSKSRNNTGYGFVAGEGAYMTNNAGTSIVGGGNSLADIAAIVMGRMHMNNAAGLGLTSSPALATVGNNNSYIMG